jgi:hypothetical protein
MNELVKTTLHQYFDVFGSKYQNIFMCIDILWKLKIVVGIFIYFWAKF